ncbi:fungal hydrophobin [Artomyces pyxidatus]|uniref:Fungal hydrophobin n=1 Tax=Artomyces pyxidatus TaxID=48021 RepID=A0ACB8TAK9_9AGAM|nr:fungal hydrophobin [Artomyces pyxidatus]
MFARVSNLLVVFLLALLLTASASPVDHLKVEKRQNTCSTGPVQCCNTVEPASAPSVAALLGLLGVVLQGVDVLVGLTCTPISVIGVITGNSCTAQTVCCQNNNFGGLINIGCTPISL